MGGGLIGLSNMSRRSRVSRSIVRVGVGSGVKLPMFVIFFIDEAGIKLLGDKSNISTPITVDMRRCNRNEEQFSFLILFSHFFRIEALALSNSNQ